MSKTIIAPLVGALCLLVQLIFKVDINADIQNQIIGVASQVVAIALVVDGIFRNHKK